MQYAECTANNNIYSYCWAHLLEQSRVLMLNRSALAFLKKDVHTVVKAKSSADFCYLACTSKFDDTSKADSLRCYDRQENISKSL